MGGGDLNLKKSWHPSTMKNMEKVWKAEQQDNQEKKRIAELKREIAMERDKEEMKAFALQQGITEKKEDKLAWMYKGPHENINREDYLLGRKIDKQFEQMVQAEKNSDPNKTKNHVEHECIPPSLRFFSGSDQVDLARKLQEDPLYAIKKKEMETRSQLLNNPVKLKQLKQLVAQQTKKNDKKKKKKERKVTSDSDESVTDKKLDDLLAAKYKKLKGQINEKDLIKSVRKHKKNKKTKKNKKRHSSESDDSEDNESSSDSDESQKRRNKKDKRRKDELHSQKSCIKRKSRDNHDFNEGKYKKRKENNSSRHTESRGDFDKQKNPPSVHKNYGLMRADGSRISPSRKGSISKEVECENKIEKHEQKWVAPKKQKLSEEEKEKRRQEMLANASWRDKERQKNLKKYEEEEKKELSNKEKVFNKEFIQKHLALAADKETVASRIKSNINNIQRFKHSMDKNFAKR